MTRLLFIFIAALLLAIAQAWPPAPALAQETGARVAVIDVQRIFREAKAAKALQARLDKRRAEVEADLRRREQELRQADLELRQARGSLSKEEFQARGQELATRAASLETDARESGRELDRLSKAGYGEIRAVLLTVVRDIAEARNLGMVLTSSAMVLQSPDLDLTDEALARLDRALPDLRQEPAAVRTDQ